MMTLRELQAQIDRVRENGATDDTPVVLGGNEIYPPVEEVAMYRLRPLPNGSFVYQWYHGPGAAGEPTEVILIA